MATTARMTRQEAEDFLAEEARLLDERCFEEWLDLFTEDGIYWMPIAEDSDPTKQTSILYDDDALRRVRVHPLLHERDFAPQPPPPTPPHITNHPRSGGAAPDP